MLRRFFAAGAVALAVAAYTTHLDASPRPEPDAYELWTDCGEIPTPFELLPTFMGTDQVGFVDLGYSVTSGAVPWRALQYTRDQDFGTYQAIVGRWYGGMGRNQWPLGSIDLAEQFKHFRVLAWEVDGFRHAIDRSCVLTLDSEELSFGLYNVWVRFTEPGVHRLRIFGRQESDFRFIYPYAAMGAADPFGLLGRRIFLRGEFIGDLLDDEFVHSYELQVSKD